MMRKNQKYIPSLWMAASLTAGILLLLAGCSDTQEPIEVDGFPVPVEIETASLTGEVETRAADVKNLEQGSIGLYRTAENDYAAIDNTPYSYTEGKWTSADPRDKAKTIFVDHRNATLYGYYPYAATPDASGTVFNLRLKRFTEEDALFYTGDMTNITNRNTALKMQLKPAYSRLTFRLKNYNLPDCVISSMTITPTASGATFITNGTIDIHHATPTVTQGSPAIAKYDFPFKTAGADADDTTIAAADSITVKGIGTGQTDETMDMLWIPQNLSGIKITIVLHFNGESVTPETANTLSVTISQDKLSQLQQGTQHIIPLLVKGTTISGSITMPSLSVVEAYDPFEEDKITSYTLPPVDVNGVYVATGDVFCYHHDLLDQIWYTFSGKSGGIFGSTKNRVTSFSQEDVKKDPCQKVGPNWHTPSAEQLKTIMNAKTGNHSSLSDRGTSNSGWYVGKANSTDGVFFVDNYKYLSRDGGYLNVTSTGMTYVDAVESSTTKYTVRCVSDTKYGTK